MKIFIEQTDERFLFSGWVTIIWRAVEENVRGLQERIYRATERRAWRQVRNLQKLLTRSISNNGGSDAPHNRVALHPYCHHQFHQDMAIGAQGLSRLPGNWHGRFLGG